MVLLLFCWIHNGFKNKTPLKLILFYLIFRRILSACVYVSASVHVYLSLRLPTNGENQLDSYIVHFDILWYTFDVDYANVYLLYAFCGCMLYVYVTNGSSYRLRDVNQISFTYCFQYVMQNSIIKSYIEEWLK